MTLVILLLAAGASSRMRGGDKLRETVEGAPLIATMARRAASVAPTLVTLPARNHPRADALTGLDVTQIPVPDAHEGMAASIRAGTAALPPGTTAVMILPADMPALTATDLHTMATAWADTPDNVLRATDADGTPGHPVIFPARLFPALAQLSGDQGARPVLATEHPRLVALPGQHATTDLDTPEAWAAWRAASPSSC